MLRRAVKSLPYGFWVWLLAAAPFLWAGFSAAVQLPQEAPPVGTHDPDSWLRLTLVRDWLQGGGWYDHHYASNAPGKPPASHWTRPLDLVIAALAALQPSGDLSLRLLRAASVLPGLCMALLLAGLIALVRRLTAAWLAPPLAVLLMLAMPPMYNYFHAGNADHHAVLAALWIWAVYCLQRWPDAPWRCALLLGLMLWISTEALALAGMVGAWLSLRWLLGDASIRPLRQWLGALSLAALAAVVIERPPQAWLVPIYDSISIVHVAFLLLATAGTLVLNRLPPLGLIGRACWGAGALMTIIVLMALAYPLFFAGPMAMADPFIQHGFLPRIREAQSPFAVSWLYAMGVVLQPLIALAAGGVMAWRGHGIIAARSAALLSFLTVASLGIYLSQLRWFYYLYPPVAALLAPWLTAWLATASRHCAPYWPATRILRHRPLGQALRRVPLVVLVFLLPILGVGLGGEGSPAAQRRGQQCSHEARRLIQEDALSHLSGGQSWIVLAPTNLGAELLFFSPHRIIAANYHREGVSIREVWQAEAMTSPSALQLFLRGRKVDALLLCPDASTRPDALLERLRTGKATLPWLVRVTPPTTLSPAHAPAIFLVKHGQSPHSRPLKE